LAIVHQENKYDDFVKELLLPHKNSNHGPFISKGDINDDGRCDLFIGGAHKQAASILIQNEKGEFHKTNQKLFEAEAKYEDMGSLFIDLDNDGDQDLYVVSGGNEWEENDPHYQDRVYMNDGKGNFTKSNSLLPDIRSSGSAVVPIINKSEDAKYVFVGGRMKAQHYPYASPSHLLKYENGSLKDLTPIQGESFKKLGIVTCAINHDFNKDGKNEIILAGEWMHPMVFSLVDDKLKDITPDVFKDNVGWWNIIEAVDLDMDGEVDFVMGNLGLNYKYKASAESPFNIYANDFDVSGNLDIVLSHTSNDKEYPVRGRECSSEQMPFLTEKFPSYDAFGKATVSDIFEGKLGEGIKHSAREFASCIFWNEGKGKFSKERLPNQAQFSSVNAIEVLDYNSDGHPDLLLAGNLFASEIETPRNDASYGCLLQGDGNGVFEYVPNCVHGLYLSGDVKDLQRILIGDQEYLLIGNNSDSTGVYKIASP